MPSTQFRTLTHPTVTELCGSAGDYERLYLAFISIAEDIHVCVYVSVCSYSESDETVSCKWTDSTSTGSVHLIECKSYKGNLPSLCFVVPIYSHCFQFSGL